MMLYHSNATKVTFQHELKLKQNVYKRLLKDLILLEDRNFLFCHFNELSCGVSWDAPVIQDLQRFVNGWYIMDGCSIVVCVINAKSIGLFCFEIDSRAVHFVGSGYTFAKCGLVYTLQSFHLETMKEIGRGVG